MINNLLKSKNNFPFKFKFMIYKNDDDDNCWCELALVHSRYRKTTLNKNFQEGKKKLYIKMQAKPSC